MVKNYDSSSNSRRLLGTRTSDTRHDEVWRDRKKHSWLQSGIFLFLILLGAGFNSFAQTNIANYSFAVGTGATYTPITGGTVAGTTYDSTNYTAIPLGGTFVFGGSSFTTCYINGNGYIGFGTAMTAGTATPLSTTGASGIISAFGQDGANSTVSGAGSEIRYQTVGDEFIVQFKDHANYYNRTTERLNFQIRLTFSTGAINIVYGSCTNPGTSTTGSTVQVGIRGNSTVYASNVNALYALNIPTGTTCDWSKAVSAYSAASTLLFTSGTNGNVKIPTGLTYTWTPGTQAPVRTFTAASAITGSAATLAWTAPSAATTYNVQYRVPGTCDWTNWSGNPVATNAVTLTGLSPLTSYQVRVQAVNGSAVAPFSHIPTGASGDGYTATGTFTTTAACAGTATAVTPSSITAATATVSWTAASPAPANGYYYEVRTSGTAGSGATGLISFGSTGAGVTSVNLSSLTPNTAYNVYVRTDCGSSQYGSWTSASTFTTLCSAIVPPYTNDFATFPGTCWNANLSGGTPATGPTGTTAMWAVDGFLNVGTTGAAKIEMWTNTRKAWLRSIPFDLSGGSTYRVKFNYAASFWNSATTAPTATATDDVIQLLISNDSGATWSAIQTWNSPNSTWNLTNTQFSFVLTGYNSATTVFAIYASDGTVDDVPDTDFFIDNFVVEVAPSCVEAAGLTASATAYNTANISWTAPASGPTPSGYEYAVTTSATPPVSGTATTGTSVTGVAGLTGNTVYYLHVRTDCSGTYSAWATSAVFTTPCMPTTTFPSSQGFNATTIPACWNTGIVAVQTATKLSYIASGSSPTTSPSEGTYMVQYNSYSSANGGIGSEERLISLPLNTTGISNVTVKFDWRNENNTSYNVAPYINEGVQLQYSTDGTTWTNMGSLYMRHDGTLAAGTAQWNTKTYYSSEIANKPYVLVAFKFHSEWGDNMFLDNVSFSQSPNCVVPSALTVTTDAATLSANIGWTAPPAGAGGTPAGYEYAITTSATPPASGTATTATSLTNIALPATNTTYYLHVRTNCDASGYSAWATSASFVSPQITAKTTGGYATPENWNNNTGPVCGQVAVIPSGIEMTVSSGTVITSSITIQSGGTLNVSGGSLTVGCADNNSTLSNSGTLNVSAGTLTVNGNIVTTTGSTFIQSNGAIIVDGNNNNVAATSVASGTPLVGFGTSGTAFSTGTVTLSGGTLTIVDPHTATANASAYALYGNFGSTSLFNASLSHTLQFGDGISVQEGGVASGFFYNLFVGSGRLNLGNVIVNNPAAVATRNVTQGGTGANVINGNFTITAGIYNQSAATTNIGGNILVQDGATFIANGITNFCSTTGTTANAQTVAQSVTVSGTGSIQNQASTPNANFQSVIFKNTSATGVTINSLNQVSGNPSVAANVRESITFDGKVSTTGGKALLWGITANSGNGNLIITSGGMLPGSAFARGWTAAQTGSSIAASALPTGTTAATSQFPLLDENGNARHAWIERVGASDPGILAVTYTAASGTTPVSITDADGYVVDTRSNGKWNVSVLGTDIAATTYKLAVSATGIFGTSPSTAVARIVTASAAPGTYQAGTTLPHAQRTGLNYSQITTNDFYIGISSSDIPFLSIATGNWNEASTWNKNAVPAATDIVAIQAGHTVTVDGSYTAVAGTLNVTATGALTVSANTLTVTNAVSVAANGAVNAAGGTLNAGTLANSGAVNASAGTISVATATNTGTITVNGGTINVGGAATTGISNNSGGTFALNSGTVNVGPSGGSDRRFTNAGTLTIAGGTLNINGNFVHSVTGIFNQSAGNINVDPNAAGATGNSTTSSNYTLYLNAPVNWTGGTLTVVDPPASTSSSHYTLYYSAATSEVSPSHTLRFGDGVSSTPGGNAIGYYIYNYVGSGKINVGNMVVNGPATGTATTTNRVVKLTGWALGVKGDFTVQNKGEFSQNGYELAVAGNFSIGAAGKFYATNTLNLALPSGISTVVNTAAQTITNAGTIENSTGTVTANLSSLTVNNNNASGVTLNSPLTMSGTLTLTSGKLNTTNTNLLTLGTATAAGTMNNAGSATAYINGPFARTFAASRTSTGAFTLNALFPVGTPSAYQAMYVDPTTAASGPVVVKVAPFVSESGTLGTGVTSLSANKWEALITSGAANLTSTYVRLLDSSITGTDKKIVHAVSAAGEYTPILPATTSAAGMLSSQAAILAADYKGYFAYGTLNPCNPPADQPTNFAYSSLTNASFTATYTAAASAPSHYVVVRYNITSAAATVTAPVEFTPYTAGTPLGAGTVVYSGAAVTFSQTGLTGGNTYQYYIYSFNNSGCYGPVYNTVSPLVASVTTCTTATGAPGSISSVAAQLTNTSLRAQWGASSTPGAAYLVDVSTSNTFTTFVPGYQALNVGTATFVDVTNLTQGTNYYVRVRALSGTECYSSYTTSGALATPTVVPVPWTEGFATTAVPTGWTTTNSYDWFIDPDFFTGNPGNALFIELLEYFDYDYYEYVTVNSGSFTTPTLGTIPAGYQFSFDYKMKDFGAETAPAAGSGQVVVSISTNYGATYTVLETIPNDGVAGWREKVYNLSGYVGQNVKFKIEASNVNDIEYAAGFDNFKVQPIPDCIKPTSLAFASLANNTANLSWTAPASGTTPTGYEYAVTTSATPPASGTAVTGTSVMGYSSLVMETTYYLHVKSNCGNGYSEWNTSQFYHGYCNSNTYYTGYYISSFTTTGAITNITNTGTALATDGYSYNPSMAVNQVPGGAIAISTTIVGSSGFNIWVDWNNDMAFGDDEKVYASGTSGTSFTGSFNVPALTALGNYRMRIRSNYNSANPTACGLISYGETEDYTLTVVAPPACYNPGTASATIVTATTANLSWTASSSGPAPSGYEYAVTTSATPPASGTATTATSVTGYGPLTLGTTYYLHVRSNCDLDGYSAWTTVSYFHDYCVATSTNATYYISSVTTTGGTANISNTATTFSPNGYSYNPSMAVSQSAGNSVTIAVTVLNGSHGINVWVDWNDDLVFSDSEKMHASGSSYVYSTTGSFSVPVGAAVGNHRMRVRANYSSTNPAACGVIISGETEDYTFTVLPSPPRITSFTPAGVCQGAGDIVTLTGSYFTGATAVKFNGTDAASFNVVSDTSITAVVPSGATTGNITVTSPIGTGTSLTALTVTPYPVVDDITGGDIQVCRPNTVQLATTTTGGTWQTNNPAIATVSSSGLVTSVAPGTVTIVYTKTTNGCTTSDSTDITFNEPVVITGMPTSETVLPASSVQFSVDATGTSLGYQWEVSVNDGADYTALANDGTYSGVTTATLTVAGVTAGMHHYKYRAVVSGTAPCAPATSDAATLSVSNIGITSHPAGVTLCDSGAGTASFTVVSTGEGLTYQWQVNSGSGWNIVNNGTTGGVTYSGADTNILSLSGITAASNTWTYRVYIEDGAASATSNSATLTVNSAVVVNQPVANQIACSTGSLVNFVADASGTGLSYQWQYATTAGGTYANVINATPAGVTYSGATTNTLAVTTTAGTPSAPTYYYRVVITGTAPCDPVTTVPATLTISNPQITTAPVAASVVKGSAVNFTVATSAAAPTYQWQFATAVNGAYSNVADETPAGTAYSGAQSATLTVNAATTPVGNAYFYRVVVTSGGCTVTSAGARMTVTDYCLGQITTSGTLDYMTAVSVATTTLNSTPGAVGDSANFFYALLTGSNNTATLAQAQSYTASISVVSGNTNPQGVGIWIDFNNDGDFADTGEFLGAASIATGATGTITMAIPATATLGNRRMRVRNVRNTTMSQGTICTNYARGTTVDYIVTIVAPAAPSITGFTPESYCADSGMITITGTNLTGSTLTIGGTAVTPVVINGAGTQLTATVNAGVSGIVSVTTPGGTAATTASFSVTAPPAITLSSATGNICAGSSSALVTITAGGSSYDTFTVTSVPAGAAWSGNAATGFTFSPVVNTVYTIAATQSGGTCARSATFSATVYANPVYAVSPTAAEICSGQVQALTSSNSASGTAIIGTDTTVASNSDTTRPNPLSRYYEGQKAQLLFLASELTAQNMTPGSKITSVTFDLGTVNTVAGAVISNFTIRMGATTTSVMTGFVSGTSTVYGPANFTPATTGLVTFTLATPFTWDGTSNVIVETIHNNPDLAWTSGTNVRYSTTSFNSTYHRMQDDVAGGIDGMDTATGTTAYASASRPNIRFAFAKSGAVWSPAAGLYTDAAATTPYNGTSDVVTVYARPTVTTTYTATANNGNGCATTSQSVITVSPKSWIGGTSSDWNNAANWCGGQVPTADDNIVISADATTMPQIGVDVVDEDAAITQNITVMVNSLTVEDGASLKVNGGCVLNITNAVIVEDEGSLVLDNYAHLLQGAAVTGNPNQGEITVNRLSSPIFRLDYTLWSSPVEDQILKDFSTGTLDNRFYTYKEATDSYSTVQQAGQPGVSETEMAEGKSYLIRVDNAHPEYNAATNPDGARWQGQFTGKPRSGTINVPVTKALNGFNSVGNPYPSPINIHAFYDGNIGTINAGSALYFWRKKNDGDTGSYAKVTKFAYAANIDNDWGDTGTGIFVGTPSTWVINPGQGFIVKVQQAGTVTFDNGMRRGLNNQQFFRNAQDEDESGISRMWLNINGTEGQFTQAVVGYSNMTTMDVDYGWDGRAFVNDGKVSLFSLAGEEKLSIQARSAFDASDVVPMGYNAELPGTYTIRLDHMDGVFSTDQDIFLKDNLLGGITHDLKAGSYTFDTEAGINTGRFEVVYTAQALGTDNPMLDPNNVIVYKQGTSININAGLLNMTDVTIYDTRGRILYSQDAINATETVISNLHSDQQVLIIQINTDKGRVTKRIIF